MASHAVRNQLRRIWNYWTSPYRSFGKTRIYALPHVAPESPDARARIERRLATIEERLARMDPVVAAAITWTIDQDKASAEQLIARVRELLDART